MISTAETGTLMSINGSIKAINFRTFIIEEVQLGHQKEPEFREQHGKHILEKQIKEASFRGEFNRRKNG